MKKQEFIDAFAEKADFLTADELEVVKQYLFDSINQTDCFSDADTFVQNMRLSFDIFKFLIHAEAERQACALGESVTSIMKKSDETQATDNNEQCQITGEHYKHDALSTKTISVKGGIKEFISKKKGTGKAAAISLCAIAFILLLPIIGLTAAVCAALYIIPLLGVLAIWLFVMLINAAFALLGTVATSYGIANLFISTPVGLMEIGLGTVLFSFMLAVWALNYQFIASIIPWVCKKVTRLLKLLLKLPKQFIFGKAVPEQ